MRAYSLWYKIYSSLVQSVERWTVNPYVGVWVEGPAGEPNFSFGLAFVCLFTNPKFVAKEFSHRVDGLYFI